MNRCVMTGYPVQGSSDAIWDDGEWISWDYINRQIEGSQPEGGLLEDMIIVAKEYLEDTGRHLPIYGEIGEHYAARRFGIELHEDPKAQGSDGRLGNALVEIKTISPMRDSRHVRVKKSGNFGFLVIVKIDADFRIDAKLIRRRRLAQAGGSFFTVGWDDHRSEHSQAKHDGGGQPADRSESDSQGGDRP
ncbi:MAG: hypothetical protein JNK37_20040 [Verrucomicrobiales bacterium]|nr:hypothetical protein [Verrucomicrobiales bacterium]